MRSRSTLSREHLTATNLHTAADLPRQTQLSDVSSNTTPTFKPTRFRPSSHWEVLVLKFNNAEAEECHTATSHTHRLCATSHPGEPRSAPRRRPSGRPPTHILLQCRGPRHSHSEFQLRGTGSPWNSRTPREVSCHPHPTASTALTNVPTAFLIRRSRDEQ